MEDISLSLPLSLAPLPTAKMQAFTQLACSNSINKVMHQLPLNNHLPCNRAQLPHTSLANYTTLSRKNTFSIRASLPPPHSDSPTQQVAAHFPLPPLQHFYLPPLQPVFPAKKHPLHHSISARVYDWLLSWMPPRTELQKKIILQTDAGGLASHVYPNAPNPQLLELLAKFIAWIQHFDDIADDSHKADAASDEDSLSSYVQFVKSVVHDPDSIAEEEIGEHPDRKAILRLSKEFRGSMSPRIYECHAHATFLFLRAVQREAGERKQHGSPDLASYIANRRQSIMFHHSSISLEYCMGIELSDDILEMEAMKALHDAAADHIGWANDVLSFRREYYNQDFENLPSLLYLEQQKQGRDGGFQSAMNRACEMMRERERDFIFHLHKMLLSDAVASNPQLLLYLQNLPYLLSGHLEWLYTSARYIGLDNQDMAKKRHGVVKMHPERTVIE